MKTRSGREVVSSGKEREARAWHATPKEPSPRRHWLCGPVGLTGLELAQLFSRCILPLDFYFKNE